MIIGSSIEWPIGSRQVGIDSYDNSPFVVLRKATRDEWMNQQKHPLSPLSLRILDEIGVSYFYEVSVD